MREIGDSGHKHLILLRIQLMKVSILSNDWYFPVSGQTWAEQNL